jgi:hypothetical protein
LDNKMNPWWKHCSEELPLWIAPNLVTLIGFGFMVSSFTFFVLLGK